MDTVASHRLTPEEVLALGHGLTEALRLAKEGYAPMSDAERRYGARFRPGAEVVLRVLARVVEGAGVTLPPRLSIGVALTELEAADELRPLAELATQVAEVLHDRVRRSEREAQSIGSAAYGALQSVGRRDGAVRQALVPAREFLRRGKRTEKADAPSSPKEVPIAPSHGLISKNQTVVPAS